MNNIYDLNALGWDDLRVAIIKRALIDYYDGKVAVAFMHYNTIKQIQNNSERKLQKEYLREIKKQLISAVEFFHSGWCDMLCGIDEGDKRALNINYLWNQADKNAKESIKILKSPVEMFTVAKGRLTHYKNYKRLYDVAREMFPQNVKPTSILDRIIYDEKTGKRLVKFSHKGVNYCGRLEG